MRNPFPKNSHRRLRRLSQSKWICYPESPLAFVAQKPNQSKNEGLDRQLSERAAAGLPTGGVTS